MTFVMSESVELSDWAPVRILTSCACESDRGDVVVCGCIGIDEDEKPTLFCCCVLGALSWPS